MTPFWPKAECQLAVFNLTDNSFSDGGELSTPSQFRQRLENWRSSKRPFILDIGAESTAPHSSKVSPKLEWERIEKGFIAHHASWSDQEVISLDTYHPETIDRFWEWKEQHQPSLKLIWNDVSGKLDQACLDRLIKYPDVTYILCHNLAPSREQTSDHMNFVYEGDNILQHLSDWLERNLDVLRRIRPLESVWIDPCFGFSKNHHDNWKLLNNLELLVKIHPKQPWVVGISRKSFLRRQLFHDRPEYQHLSRAELNQVLDQYALKKHLAAMAIKETRMIARLHTPLDLVERTS